MIPLNKALSVFIAALLMFSSAAVAQTPTSVDCTKASSLKSGEISPCSGVLWSFDQTRSALLCVKSSLPTCLNDKQLQRERYNAEQKRLRLLLSDAEDRLKSKSGNDYVLLSATLTSVTLGVIAGYFLFSKQP
tara:strand:+ start:5635 stop:6033 length:399 start_codon:yes stop_codon:yes gene_type:complete